MEQGGSPSPDNLNLGSKRDPYFLGSFADLRARPLSLSSTTRGDTERARGWLLATASVGVAVEDGLHRIERTQGGV
jgi:hypothetical protein